MPFDPDAYLAKQGGNQGHGGFDPDAYLAKSNDATAPVAKVYDKPIGPDQEHAVDRFKERITDPKRWQAILTGTGPHAADVVQGEAPVAALPAAAVPLRALRFANAVRKSPILRIPAAGTQGFIQGAVDTHSGADGNQMVENAQDAGMLSAGVQTAAEVLPPLLRPAGKALGRFASKSAAEAVGGTKAQLDRLGGRLTSFGQEILDKNIINPLSTPGTVARKVSKDGGLLESAGKRIGDLLERSEAAGAAKVDPTDVAVRLLDDADIQKWRLTPGAKNKAAIAEEYADQLAANKEMTLRDLHEFRRRIDWEMKLAGRDRASDKEEVLYKIRDLLNEKMNDAVNAVAPKLGEGADALIKANKEYSTLSTISQFAEGRANAPTFSFTDKLIGAGAGLASGGEDPESILRNAAIGAFTSKAARSIGKSSLARGANALATRTNRLANISEWAQRNPVAFQAIVGLLTNVNERQAPAEITPEQEQIFRENPKLLESIQDPRIKAMLEKRLGRAPSGDSAIERRLKSQQ